jgi:hypothetical protein
MLSNESSLKEVQHEVKRLMKNNHGNLAIIFDKGKGWCVSSDMDLPKPRFGKGSKEYQVITVEDRFCATLEEAFAKYVHAASLQDAED